MQDKQVTEVQQTNEVQDGVRVQREVVRQAGHASGSTVAQRVVYYIGGFIISLLALRLILLLLGASQGNAFVDFVYALSGLFAAPFQGIFGTPVYGNSVFDTSTVVAIIVYAILTVGIAKLFTLTRPSTDV
jgi:hypothetical protein